MKKDIKILEEKINKDYKDMIEVINSTSLPLFVEDTIEDMHILIEHLIARNKELTEEIQNVNMQNMDLIRKDSYWKTEAIPKSAINFLLKEDYIPKSKVREKIEELEKELEEKKWGKKTLLGFRNRIKVLQELLED